LFIVLFYPLNVYCGMLLWRVVMDDSGKYYNAHSFMQLGELTSGKFLKHFSAVAVYLMVLLSNADYFLVIGQTLGLVFNDIYICLSDWIFIACILVLVLQQIRTFEELKWLLWVNMATITLTLIVSLGYVGSLSSDIRIPAGQESENIPAGLTWLSFANAFSKIAFAYSGQMLYLEFLVEMKKPEEFPKAVYRLAGPYQLGLYLLSGTMGYYLKGLNATGLMVDWIPFNGWLRFGALLLWMHVVIIYVVNAQILAKAAHRILFPDTFIKRDFRSRIHWLGITLCLTVFCVIIAESVPFFDSLTGLVGALLVPISSWILPIIYLILVKQKKKDLKDRISTIEWGILGFIALLGVVLTIFGTYSNMLDIVDNWST